MSSWDFGRFVSTILVAALSWSFLTVCVLIALKTFGGLYDINNLPGLLATAFILLGILIVGSRVLLVDPRSVPGVGHNADADADTI